jgi:hypothetical protein
MTKQYNSFKEFYPFYLSQHQNTVCRRMHFIGLVLFLLTLGLALYFTQYKLIILCPILGYLFAWIGHFVFEKNIPATFTYPVYSFIGDWFMFKDILLGKIKIF